MTYTQTTMIGSTRLRRLLRSLGTLVTVTMLIGLTSCVTDLPPNVSALNIYQPSTLRLSEGSPIQTVDGVYTPQTNEVWHSDARYRRLEREVYSK